MLGNDRPYLNVEPRPVLLRLARLQLRLLAPLCTASSGSFAAMRRVSGRWTSR